MFLMKDVRGRYFGHNPEAFPARYGPVKNIEWAEVWDDRRYAEYVGQFPKVYGMAGPVSIVEATVVDGRRRLELMATPND